MAAVLECGIFRIGELEVYLVNERSGLKRFVRLLLAPGTPRDAVQLVVNERNQPIKRGLITLGPRGE
jgi:hypothetical protein